MMIKALTLTLVGAGVIGTGAQTMTPQKLEISAGVMVLEVGTSGLTMDVAETPEFGVTLTAKGDRQFTLRL